MPLPKFVETTRDNTELPPFDPQMDKDLKVPLQQQKQTQWCWAAVALGIAEHYAQPNPPQWKQQCTFVNDFLERNDCCGAEGSAACNMPRAISLALEKADHYEDLGEQVEFATLQKSIDSGRPVVLRIKRGQGGKTYGHFVVVDAYKSSSNAKGFVAVRNPDQPRSDIVPYAGLKSKSYEEWEWDYTFLTKPAEAGTINIESLVERFLESNEREASLDEEELIEDEC